MPIRIKDLLPGILAAAVVSAAALIIGWGEAAVFRRAIIEPLVLAILIGMVVRTVRGDHPREDPGVRFIATEPIFATLKGTAMLD